MMLNECERRDGRGMISEKKLQTSKHWEQEKLMENRKNAPKSEKKAPLE